MNLSQIREHVGDAAWKLAKRRAERPAPRLWVGEDEYTTYCTWIRGGTKKGDSFQAGLIRPLRVHRLVGQRFAVKIGSDALVVGRVSGVQEEASAADVVRITLTGVVG